MMVLLLNVLTHRLLLVHFLFHDILNFVFQCLFDMIWLESVEYSLRVIFLPMDLLILHVRHHGSFLHKFLKIFVANFYRFYLSIIKTIRIRFLFNIQTDARLILRFFKLIWLLIHF